MIATSNNISTSIFLCNVRVIPYMLLQHRIIKIRITNNKIIAYQSAGNNT